MMSHPAKDEAPAPGLQITCLACTNGAMKCVSLDSLESYNPTLCILLYAISRYLPIVDKRRIHIGLDSMLRKVKCPILVEAGRASATAEGTTALIVGNKNFKELGARQT